MNAIMSYIITCCSNIHISSEQLNADTIENCMGELYFRYKLRYQCSFTIQLILKKTCQ